MNQVLYKVMSLIDGEAEARLTLLRNEEESISVINRKLEKAQKSESLSLAITLYIDGREGFFYTNVLDDDSLQRFVKQGIETTRLLAPDTARRLISPDRYYKGGYPDLKNCDESLADIPTDRKMDIAFAGNAEVYGKDSRAISVDTRYVDRVHHASYLTSNGFEASESSSRVTLSTIISVQGDGDARPMDGWGQTRLFFNDLPWQGVGDVALQRALRKLGQHPVPTGNYTIVVESPVANSLLSPLFSAMSGQALQQHSSFLENKLGEKIGSNLLDIVDNPHIPGTRGATYFDYDGAATQPRKLFDKGTLCTYFIDTPMSIKLGMAPTTQGIHHVILSPSKSSLHDVLCHQDECILITDFNGGNCNPVTGHFSYGIEGFLCRKGVYVQSVSGMNITGNMLDLWQHLVEVANDADTYETELIPSLAFEGVSVY